MPGQTGSHTFILETLPTEGERERCVGLHVCESVFVFADTLGKHLKENDLPVVGVMAEITIPLTLFRS